MSRAFRADRERQVYMGDATHRKPTANKPKQGDMKMKTETETPKYNNAQIAMIENALDLAIIEVKKLRKEMVATQERIALANKALHSRPHTNNGSDLAYMICNAIDALEPAALFSLKARAQEWTTSDFDNILCAAIDALEVVE